MRVLRGLLSKGIEKCWDPLAKLRESTLFDVDS
jgi:hypothetical protein